MLKSKIMEAKAFRKKYDLELIPASHGTIILGNLVWDSLFGKPKFEKGGMPNHLLNAFVDAELMNQEQWQQLMDELRQAPLHDAHMAGVTLEVDGELSAELEHPQIDKLKAGLNWQKNQQVSFGDIQVRTLANLTRMEIDEYLEEMRRNKWEDYDGKIRRVFVITELYYGSLKITVDKNFGVELEAAAEAAGLDSPVAFNLGRKTEYTFDHAEVPFAMRLERVKKFNG